MKFPRTYHLPWSPGATSDDKILSQAEIEGFLNTPLVITEKLDGENQCWTDMTWHLRSESSNTGGILRSKSKAKWAEIRYLIPAHEFWFIEDISNQHSIEYQDHSHEFYIIAIWNQKEGLFESYDRACQAAETVGLGVVPLIGKASFSSLDALKIYTNTEAIQPSRLGGEREGLVCRIDQSLPGWSSYSAKWVRANHVTTDTHWTRNLLSKS